MPISYKSVLIWTVKLLGWVISIVLVLFLTLVFVIRSPSGQELITQKATNYISDKTKTRFDIERLYLTFDGNLFLEGLYAEDTQGDTLIFSRSVEVGVAIVPLITGEQINVKFVHWQGLSAHVVRKSPQGNFNFDFLINAFSSESEEPTEIEENSKPAVIPEIVIGEILLNGIHLAYEDEVLGMRTALDLKSLRLEVEKLDIEKSFYAIDNLNIDGMKAQYLQYTALPISPPDTFTSTTPLPTLVVKNLQLNNISAYYESSPDSLLLNAYFSSLALSLPKADIQNQLIDIENLTMSSADIQFDNFSTTNSPNQNNSPAVFIWPDWTINAKNIELSNNQLLYRTNSKNPLTGVFDPNCIQVSKANISLNDVIYKDQKASLKLMNVSFTERSGFNLNTLKGQLSVDDRRIVINNLDLKTGYNALKGKAKISYESLDYFLKNPDKSNFSMELYQLALSMKDATYFQPDILENALINTVNAEKVRGNVSLSGDLNQLKVKDLSLKWGNTILTALGQAQNILVQEKLVYDLSAFSFKTTKKDISRFVEDSDNASYLPSSLQIEGSGAGSLKELQSKLNIKSTLGDAQLNIDLDMFDTLRFGLDMTLKKILLSEILADPSFDTLSMAFKLQGKGQELSSFDGAIDASFESLGYQGYDFSAVKINGNIKNGEATTFITYSDSSLNAEMKAMLALDTVTTKAELSLNVIGAALQPLGLSDRDIRTAFKLAASFEGDANAYDLNLAIENGLAVYNSRSYDLGQFKGNIHVRNDSSNINIDSEIIDLFLKSNTSPERLFASLNDKFNAHWGGQTRQDSTGGNVMMRMEMVMRNNPILSSVFLPDLNAFDSMSFNMWYDQLADSVSANFIAPFIDYQGNTLDSLSLDLTASASKVGFNLGWNKVVAGPVIIEETTFDGTLERDSLFLEFLVTDKEEILFHVNSLFTIKSDTIYYHLNPEELILNKTQWQTPKDNFVAIADQFIEFHMFSIQNNKQQIEANSIFGNNKQEEVSLNFKNFELTTFTRFFNTDKDIVNGITNGNIKIMDPFGNSGLEADLIVKNFSVLETGLGRLSLFGRSTKADEYDFDLSMSDGPVVFGLAGNYATAVGGQDLDLALHLEKLEMQLVQDFAQGELSNARGYISGDLSVTGKLDQPQYTGKLVFNEVGAKISYLNSDFSLPTERIVIDNQRIHFDKFTVIDEQKNSFLFDGDVLTDDPANPTFNLTLKAKNFQAVNAQKGDNDLFYGKVLLNADLTIDGSLNLPKIRGSFKVNEGSDLTVIVPESQLSLVEREGVVIFVNKDQPDKIITRVKEERVTANLVGIDLYTNLIVEDNSIFRVLIDEQTGDNFEVSGRGDFTVGVDPTGRTTLAGRYRVSDGHYRASLYGLVKRKFSISPESVITWRGDPMDANLDVAAIYEVRTSASPIMAASVTSSSQSVAKRYNTQLPFQVFLNVEGQLLQPELSFQLDMPEESQGAIGGEVYSRIQQLNKQESELNKQVFSLLVLNRFFPATGSDGSAGGAEAIARNNVSKVLSGQLNAFSEKLLGQTGFELNFGLNSYTADQSVNGTSGTQLDVSASKSLFDDRLVVQVGSEVGIEGSGQSGASGSPLIGNVSVEYRLSENGRYRLKGFRKNEFENVIQGQLIVTGIALIFNREFNKFRELFEKSAEELENGDNQDQK
ncbi:MAG: translocation/assembly module TamB domain-containing protein [Cyclobacteriaceae bacterium]